MVDDKYYRSNLSCFVVFIWLFSHLHMLFTFSVLISNTGAASYRISKF